MMHSPLTVLDVRNNSPLLLAGDSSGAGLEQSPLGES
jgi:hypothetical protein